MPANFRRPTTMNAFLKPMASRAIHSKAVRALAATCVVASTFGMPAFAVNITRFALNYTTIDGGGSLKGFMDVDIDNAGAKLTVTGGSIPVWLDKLMLDYFDGSTTTTLTKSSFDALYWTPYVEGTVDWNLSLLDQFADINFGYVSSTPPFPALNTYSMLMLGSDMDTNTFLLTKASLAVPGPLPLLGAGAAFAWSRQLRRRQATVAKPSSI
jgi:hypothetical protein